MTGPNQSTENRETTDASTVSLGGETAKGSLAKFVMAATGFVGMILFANILGPTEFGGFYLLLSLVTLVDRPVIGWAGASKKRFSEAGFSKGEIVGGQTLVNAVWLLFIGLGVIIAAGWLRSYTGLEDAPILFIVLVWSLVLYTSFEPLIMARGLVGVTSWVDALRSYITFPLQLGLVLAGFGAAGMVYGLAGATVLTTPLLWYYVATRPAFPSVATMRSLAAYARYSIPTAFFGRIYDRFDILLLGFLLVPTAAGQYEVAFKFTSPALFVADTAGNGLMARVSNLRSKGKAVSRDVSNTLSFTSLLSIPIFFGALAMPKSLVVTFFGGKFAAAAPLLIGLALYRVIQSLTIPIGQTINGLDMPEVNMRVSGVALAFNVVTGVVLTIRFGEIGVVIATVLAESLKYVWFAHVVRREVPDVTLFPRPLLDQLVAAVVMFVVVWSGQRVVVVRSWLDMALLLLVGGAVYGGVLVAISDQLRVTIGSVLRGSKIEQFVPHPILQW